MNRRRHAPLCDSPPGRAHWRWHAHHHRHHKLGRFQRRRSLFWKVFRHGVVMLLLAGIAGGMASRLTTDGSWWQRLPGTLASWVAFQMEEAGGDQAALTRQLTSLAALHQIHLTAFGPGGEVLATTAQPPLPPLSAAQERELGEGDRLGPGPPRSILSSPLIQDGRRVGYIRFRVPHDAPALWRPLAVLAAVLAAVALVSLPLARHLAAPVTAMTRAVRAFGEGDLSARVGNHRQDELGQLAQAFDAMAEGLSGLIMSQKELLANVSHELRTPLARIQVALELAEDTGDAGLYLSEISQDLDELNRMLEDVLTTARLDLAEGRAGSADPPLRFAPLDPAGLVTEAAGRFRARWEGRDLAAEVAEGLPSLVGDAVLLRRVLDNLLDNARKYSPEGSPIVVRARAEGAGLVFEVEDQGDGVSEADLAHLFEPFFRADRSRTRGTGGVGLGLALARRIVEGHGGRIEAESEEGVGTCIRFTLPLAPPGV